MRTNAYLHVPLAERARDTFPRTEVATVSSPPPAASPPPTSASPASTSSTTVVKRTKSRTWVVAVVAVVILVIAGLAVGYEEKWFGGSSTTKPLAACGGDYTLQGNGAQIALPLMNQWETNFSAQTTNLVNYPAAGSGTGITDFSEHPPLIDFAVTDDPLTASENAALPGAALTLPMTAGAIILIYNLPGLTGHLDLTGNVTAGIYLGTITNWNSSAIAALNPGVNLPNQPILTVHREDAAGTTYVLTDFLSADNATWAAGPGKGISISWPDSGGEPHQVAPKGNSAVITEVQTTPYTIGYSDLTDVLAASSPIQYAEVQNPKGNFVVPTLASAASAITDKLATVTLPAASDTSGWYNVSMVNAPGATDYPLATFIFLFVYKAVDQGYEPSVEKAQVLVQWLNWVVTTGQTLSTYNGLNYVALPSTVVAIDQAGIQSMTFNGAAIPSCS